MPVTINNNVSSLKSQRRLFESTASLQKSFERLSSGLRINRASDDAAGLAIASSLQADSRIYSQGVRNLNDVISALSIAQDAAQEIGSVVTRIQELAQQSANGVLLTQQRKALDSEAQQLRKEVNRIVATTSFAGLELLSANASATLSAEAGGSAIVLPSTAAQISSVGDETFVVAASANFGHGALGGLLVDMNNDGKSDMINFAQGSDRTTIVLGRGDGTFGAFLEFAKVGSSANYKFAAGDFNQDGRTDIFVAGNNGSGISAGVYLGNGDGTLRAGTLVGAAHSVQGQIQTADFNGDGFVDVLVGERNAGGAFYRYMGNGDGTFQAPVSLAYSGLFTNESIIYDFDGDGVLDVVGKGDNESWIALGNSNGS